MGNLLKGTPFSEITSTLEALDRNGVTAQHLRAVRQDEGLATRVALYMINGGKDVAELPYAHEEVESTSEYPKGFRPRSAEEQLGVWKEHLPLLEASHVLELAEKPLPEGAELWAVVPKPSKVEKTYHMALEKMLGLIVSKRPFKNWRVGELTEKHLRLTEKTKAWLGKLEEETPGDYLVIAVQLGMKHRGRSVRRARVCFAGNEVGLGPYEVAAILVTHPDRIGGANQLYIDSAGAEYGPGADGSCNCCLCFLWSGNVLNLRNDWIHNSHRHFGSASSLGSAS